MKVSQIEKAIVTIEFMLKKKRERVEEMMRRTDLNQSQRIFIGEEEALMRAIEMLLKRYRDDVNKSLGKLPPQALDLEESVLGAIILENKVSEVIGFLKEAHFYEERNKIIFRALVGMSVNGDPIDMRTLAAHLRKSGTIELVGGAYYIAELTSKVSNTTNVQFHSRILIEMAVKRELILLGGTIINDGYADTVDCFELLEASQERFKEISEWTKK